MHELREAIEARKVVRFICAKLHYLAEPYLIDNDPRTLTFVVIFYVIEGPGGPDGMGWKRIRFSNLRELEIQREKFTPRPIRRW